jgi:hypothetical protein
MTVCGLVRLDGVDVRRAALTAMLAASAWGLPAARRVHLDGAFGAVTAAEPDADPAPPIAVNDAGLIVIADLGSRTADLRRPLSPSVPASVPATAAAYRAGGRWALLGSAIRATIVLWEPLRSRLVLARPSGARTDLVTWSDGRVFAFGTEVDQVLTAGPTVALGHRAQPRWLGRGEVVTVAVPAPRRRAGLAAVRGPGATRQDPASQNALTGS